MFYVAKKDDVHRYRTYIFTNIVLSTFADTKYRRVDDISSLDDYTYAYDRIYNLVIRDDEIEKIANNAQLNHFESIERLDSYVDNIILLVKSDIHNKYSDRIDRIKRDLTKTLRELSLFDKYVDINTFDSYNEVSSIFDDASYNEYYVLIDKSNIALKAMRAKYYLYKSEIATIIDLSKSIDIMKIALEIAKNNNIEFARNLVLHRQSTIDNDFDMYVYTVRAFDKNYILAYYYYSRTSRHYKIEFFSDVNELVDYVAEYTSDIRYIYYINHKSFKTRFKNKLYLIRKFATLCNSDLYDNNYANDYAIAKLDNYFLCAKNDDSYAIKTRSLRAARIFANLVYAKLNDVYLYNVIARDFELIDTIANIKS